MARNAWQIDTKWLNAIDRDVRAGAQRVCNETSAQALGIAQAAVPEDKGALRVSGYVKTPRRSGYENAVGAARARPDTRISVRTQVLPELSPPARDGQKTFAWSAFDFPLSYGELVQKGYFNARAGRQIPGVDFIDIAVNEVENDFQRAMREVLSGAIRRHRPRRK